jgi:NAD+ synthase (glutamine-hydrolysing)
MKHGFIKVAAVTPKVRVSPILPGTRSRSSEKAWMTQVAAGAKIVVFPELCLTGYTCGDLFLQETLLRKAKLPRSEEGGGAYRGFGYAGLSSGVPLVRDGKLYNTAAVLQNGSILAFVPKRFIPNYSEFYEMRHYTPGGRENTEILFEGQTVPFGSRILLISTRSRACPLPPNCARTSGWRMHRI